MIRIAITAKALEAISRHAAARLDRL